VSAHADGRADGRADELRAKLARVRALLLAHGWPGVVLTHPGSVAWLTAGLEDPIERGAATGLAWALVTPERATILTTNVELPRLTEEWDLAALGLDAVAAEWFAPDGLTAAAEQAAGAPRAALAADGHPDFGTDAADALTALRLTLLPAEQDRLRALAADAARGLESAVAAWRPGDRDLDLAAAIAAQLEAAGVFPACLLVGGDDRVERFRHPVVVGAPMRRHAMAVAVGTRGGLHVALTRFASAAAPAPGLAAAHRAAHLVEARVLDACVPGTTYGAILAAAAGAYAQAGAPDAWREHYQGGPVGYRQREFEIAPGQDDGPWAATPVAVGHAVAFNPSVAGGGKAEDTFLVGAGGLECLTETGVWPVAPPAPGLRPRPQILDLSNGETLYDNPGRRV
jgi:Xaa-Pro dipeptidase